MFNNIFTIDWLYYYIDSIFYIKVKLYELYELIFIDNSFVLNDVELYVNISKKYNVKYYFDNCFIDRIDNKLIHYIYDYYNLTFIDNEDIRLKLNFNYKNNNYILYYPLHKQIFKDFSSEKYYIPYPPYNENIMSNFRKSIIEPIYNIPTKKSIIYSLFMIDSKNLHKVELNRMESFASSRLQQINIRDLSIYWKPEGMEVSKLSWDPLNNSDNIYNNIYNDSFYQELINDKLLKYFNKIKTPFNDFGLSYNCPVKVKWIFIENKINIENFNNLFIKFLNIYLDDNDFELKEHIINITNIEDFIISERMKSELLIKNQEILNELNKNL